ncbi:ubiquitin-conjugating enzyme E2 J1 [Podospora australis]|uniref:Ubiquitin-conjugating enzyme E2 J1 n=1 Tax=Podospora australis TaxID=1536484 RepID=A0AAN6X3T5_9PEZI|nr:ubiquitin-conjugating enzyme E2 J1 [Podospora australis]
MATPRINSKSPTIRRILKEAQELSHSPSPDFSATPLETDLFEWHFTLRGPPNSPFSGGLYHGRITLPQTYPLRPPSFRFLTPSGRFEVNREICLSISGHHEETWQPAWGVRTALVALRTFMETDVKGQLGGLETGPEVRKQLAAASGGWKCSGGCAGGKSNKEIMEEHMLAVVEAEAKQGDKTKKEEVIPEELRMGWRDEMKPTSSDGEEKEDAKLAEMFVRTGNPSSSSTTTQTTAQVPTTATTTGGSVQAGQSPGLVQHTEEVRAARAAVWLDRLIVAVTVLLVAVVAKVMLG